MIGVRFLAEAEIFLFATSSGTTLGPTQPLIKWVMRALLPEVNQPQHDAHSSLPSSADVMNVSSFIFNFHKSSKCGK
jgi:hypothetical protein